MSNNDNWGPQYGPAPAGYRDPAPAKFNTCAIVGFILAFLLWLPGLIVSIVAVVQTGRRRERGRGLAIAGIIISVVMAVVSIAAGVVMTRAALDAASKPAAVATAPAPAAPSALDNGIEKGLDDLEKDESSAGVYKPYSSMAEFAASSLLQDQMKEAIGDSFDGTGAQVTYRAEGDVLVIDLAMPAQYAAAGPQLAQQFDALDSSDMQSFADALPEMVATTGQAGVRMYIHAGSTSIWDHTWLAS